MLPRQQERKKQYLYHYDTIAFNALQAKVFRLIEEIHADRFGKAAKIELCVNDLILHINRSIYETEHPSIRKESNALYDNLIQYIEASVIPDSPELANGIFLSILNGGIALGIAIGGFLVDGFGIMSIFIAGALFLLIALIMMFYVIKIMKIPLKYS